MRELHREAVRSTHSWAGSWISMLTENCGTGEATDSSAPWSGLNKPNTAGEKRTAEEQKFGFNQFGIKK